MVTPISPHLCIADHSDLKSVDDIQLPPRTWCPFRHFIRLFENDEPKNLIIRKIHDTSGSPFGAGQKAVHTYILTANPIIILFPVNYHSL